MPTEPLELSEDLAQKRDAAIAKIRSGVPDGKLAVAFSGGVDSTLLLDLAVRALGCARVVAVTARSESLPAAELQACRRIARAIGVELLELETRELERDGYRQNGADRCYHCKSELFDRIDEIRAARTFAAVAYGVTRDDVEDPHRPGQAAARERGVLKPLADAELRKADIRAISRAHGLETWDKPAQACLASRIPHGTPVTAERLAQVERAEAEVLALGFREVRVRHHGDVARLELSMNELPRALEPAVRERIVRGLRAAGFRFVALDLEGFRSGSLNAPSLVQIGAPKRGNDAQS